MSVDAVRTRDTLPPGEHGLSRPGGVGPGSRDGTADRPSNALPQGGRGGPPDTAGNNGNGNGNGRPGPITGGGPVGGQGPSPGNGHRPSPATGVLGTAGNAGGSLLQAVRNVIGGLVGGPGGNGPDATSNPASTSPGLGQPSPAATGATTQAGGPPTTSPPVATTPHSPGAQIAPGNGPPGGFVPPGHGGTPPGLLGRLPELGLPNPLSLLSNLARPLVGAVNQLAGAAGNLLRAGDAVTPVPLGPPIASGRISPLPGPPNPVGLLPPGARPPGQLDPAGHQGQAPGLLSSRPVVAPAPAQSAPVPLPAAANTNLRPGAVHYLGKGDVALLTGQVRASLPTQARDTALLPPTGWRPAGVADAGAAAVRPQGTAPARGDLSAQPQLVAARTSTQPAPAAAQGRADGPAAALPQTPAAAVNVKANAQPAALPAQQAMAALIAGFRGVDGGVEMPRSQQAERSLVMRGDGERMPMRFDAAGQPVGIAVDGAQSRRAARQRARDLFGLAGYLLSGAARGRAGTGAASARLREDAQKAAQNLLWVCAVVALIGVAFGLGVAWDRPPLTTMPAFDRVLFVVAGSLLVTMVAFIALLLRLRRRFESAARAAVHDTAAATTDDAQRIGDRRRRADAASARLPHDEHTLAAAPELAARREHDHVARRD